MVFTFKIKLTSYFLEVGFLILAMIIFTLVEAATVSKFMISM